ncbi:MAG TPA: RNA polymerase sigma factor [Candidatus Binatus sp.]|nr:RNA polymerase sigma factor [Candidatus Binatus sp.]
MKAPAQDAGERGLVEAAQKDPTRFAELYENNFARVYAYVSRRVNNREEAQDLTAEVFHQALANLGRFEWRGVPFAAWLVRIAANAIADRWKLVAREHGNPISGELSSKEISPEEIHHHARLFRLVDTLPAEQRRVIEMRFAQEKSISEIAKEIGRTEGAVKQLQFRGLESLRSQLHVSSRKSTARKSAGRMGRLNA